MELSLRRRKPKHLPVGPSLREDSTCSSRRGAPSGRGRGAPGMTRSRPRGGGWGARRLAAGSRPAPLPPATPRARPEQNSERPRLLRSPDPPWAPGPLGSPRGCSSVERGDGSFPRVGEERAARRPSQSLGEGGPWWQRRRAVLWKQTSGVCWRTACGV